MAQPNSKLVARAALDAGASAQITRTISLFGSAVYDHAIDGAKTWAAGGRLGVKVAW